MSKELPSRKPPEQDSSQQFMSRETSVNRQREVVQKEWTIINDALTKRGIETPEAQKEVFQKAGVTEREEQIIFERYVNGKTNAQIGETLGVTGQNVSRVRTGALDKLYEVLDVPEEDRRERKATFGRPAVHSGRQDRISALQELYSEGDTTATKEHIAEKLGVRPRTLSKYESELGMRRSLPDKVKKDWGFLDEQPEYATNADPEARKAYLLQVGLEDKEAEIVLDRKAGKTNREIAEKYGYTPQNISRIVLVARKKLYDVLDVEDDAKVTPKIQASSALTAKKDANIQLLQEVINNVDVPTVSVIAERMGVTIRSVYNYLNELGMSKRDINKKAKHME